MVQNQNGLHKRLDFRLLPTPLMQQRESTPGHIHFADSDDESGGEAHSLGMTAHVKQYAAGPGQNGEWLQW